MARMRAEDRRRQLLEVAADVFARLGFRGATTAALAEAAGVTEPVLYRHFDSKLELFVTLVDEVGREVIHAWQDHLDGVDDAGKRLDILLAGNPATHERGRGIYRVIFQAMTDADGDRAIRRAIDRHMKSLHTFIAGELGALQKSGVVRDDEPAPDLAWLLISTAIGYGMLRPLSAKAAPERTQMQQLVREAIMA